MLNILVFKELHDNTAFLLLSVMQNDFSRENCYFVKFSDVHLYNKVYPFKNNFIKMDILKILPFHFITILFQK